MSDTDDAVSWGDKKFERWNDGVCETCCVLVMIDLDNTLGNRTRAVQAWAHEFSEDWALPLGAVDWILEHDNDGYSSRAEVFTAIKERYSVPVHVEQLLSGYQERVIGLAAPTEGALEALVGLRSAGHTIAIVTNGSTKQQHGKIDAMGLRDMVDAVVVSGDLQIKKPDRRIFEAAASATHMSLEGSWMVGDAAHHDVVGGHGVGAKSAWLHRGRQWTETSCRPTVILDDLTQLCDALLEHG